MGRLTMPNGPYCNSMLPSRATGGRQAPWLHRLRLHSMATKPVPVVTQPVACFCGFSQPSKGFRTVVGIFPAALPKPKPPRLRLSELTI